MVMKEDLYQTAYDYLLKNGWSVKGVNGLREAGRMMVIGTYLEYLNGFDAGTVQYGFWHKLNKRGEELNSPPFYSRNGGTFESEVEREFAEHGYSLTLDISIEDLQTPGGIDIDDQDEVLKYLLEFRENITKKYPTEGQMR